MSPLLSFGLGMASIGIVVLGARLVIGHNDALRDGKRSAHRTEISVDRLREIPTDELTHLAEQFHVLTVHMYEELCTRRAAERGTAAVEAMLRDQDGSAA
jgi:hypothetical protein